jgi:hypothetical protein
VNRTLVWLAVAVMACESTNPSRFEGDNAFECEDGADNDRDGDFDCADSDCFGSPSCDDYIPPDPAPDTDEDSNSSSDPNGFTDDPDAIADHLRTVTLVYTQTHDVGAGDPGIDALACDSYDICDCVMEVSGSGTFVSAEGDLVVFHGSWEVSNLDEEGSCSASIRGGSWVPQSGQAFHSFRFKNGLDRLDQWMAHSNEADVDPRPPNLFANEQFGIWLMNASFDQDSNSTDHTETSTGIIELFTDQVEHHLVVSFDE